MKKKDDYYVYVYLDPDTRQPFYIGNGRGQRCRRHLKFKKPKTEKEKRIADLFAEHRNPIIQIIQWDMTKREAEKTEAAIIELFGIQHLSNIQSGRGTAKINADFLEYTFRSDYDWLKERKTKGVPVVAVQVGANYRAGMSQYELYDYARGPWKVTNIDDVKKRKIVLVVQDYWVIDVYVNPIWLAAGSCAHGCRCVDCMDKHEFVAQFANPKTRNRYIGKRIGFNIVQGHARLVHVL